MPPRHQGATTLFFKSPSFPPATASQYVMIKSSDVKPDFNWLKDDCINIYRWSYMCQLNLSDASILVTPCVLRNVLTKNTSLWPDVSLWTKVSSVRLHDLIHTNTADT